MIENWLRKLAQFLLDAAIAWVKNPDNRHELEVAGVWVAEKIATATPNKIDDLAVDLIADGVAGKLNLSDVEQRIVNTVIGVPGQVVSGLPDFVGQFRALINKAMAGLPFPFNEFQI